MISDKRVLEFEAAPFRDLSDMVPSNLALTNTRSPKFWVPLSPLSHVFAKLCSPWGWHLGFQVVYHTQNVVLIFLRCSVDV